MDRIHHATGVPGAGLVRHLIGTDDDETIEAHTRRYAALRRYAEPLPRVADLLRACAGRGVAVVLGTSGPSADLDRVLPAIGAGDAVAGTPTSDDVEQDKPAPDPLGTAIHDHDPRRTVVVGDAVWDVEAARRADLPSIAPTCGGISAGELAEAGAGVVHTDPARLLDDLDDSPLGRITTT